nr:MAG TPA: hypothetical protein [Caudoviricetes sp.]
MSSCKPSIYFHLLFKKMSEARGGIIPIIITVNFYALQIVLDMTTLGIIQYSEGLHRYTPIYYLNVTI